MADSYRRRFAASATSRPGVAISDMRFHFGPAWLTVPPPARLILEIDIPKLLSGVVAHARGLFLDGPRRREAALTYV